MKTWKSVLRLFGRVVLVGIPFWAVWIYAIFGKMNYLDGEGVYYLWMRDAIHDESTNPTVLILGDSAVNAAVNPSLMPGEALSLANGGGCPYEAYYMLKEYLEHHEAPKTIYIGYGHTHMEGTGALWGRTFYTHLLEYGDARELLHTMDKMDFTWGLDTDGNPYLKLLAYYANTPGSYMTAMMNAGWDGRYETNLESVATITENQGHYIGLTDDVYPDYTERNEENYLVAPICDEYVHRLMDLCQEQGIVVRWITIPMCDNMQLSQHYLEAEDAYYSALLTEYDNMTYLPALDTMTHEQFLDIEHMNNAGCAYFTNYLVTTYAEDFN